MKILYDIIFLAFAFICLPVYLFKGKFHRGFLRRLGFLPKGISLDRPVWIHAVSVGEIIAMRGLIEELRRNFPRKDFVISTVTPTGNKIAASFSKGNDFVTYLPLDVSFITDKVIKRIKPCVFIIAETEIWPNLITSIHKYNIPIALVNARISDRSFKGYSKIKFLLKPILNKINIFCGQTETDALKLKALGVDENKVIVTGNMKFDRARGEDIDGQACKRRIGMSGKDRLFVAGSTHPGEEGLLLSAYRVLLGGFPELRLLLAPRHPHRAGEVANLVRRSGFSPLMLSSLSAGPAIKGAVLILDTVGELVSFYAAADIVFVGGSLIKKGGHNILEPAGIGKPVFFGPYMFNFSDITEEFLSNGAAIQVRGPQDLALTAKGLLSHEDKAASLVKNAREVITRNRGATERNAGIIRKLIA